jgi:chromosome segregation ATPase
VLAAPDTQRSLKAELGLLRLETSQQMADNDRLASEVVSVRLELESANAAIATAKEAHHAREESLMAEISALEAAAATSTSEMRELAAERDAARQLADLSAERQLDADLAAEEVAALKAELDAAQERHALLLSRASARAEAAEQRAADAERTIATLREAEEEARVSAEIAALEAAERYDVVQSQMARLQAALDTAEAEARRQRENAGSQAASHDDAIAQARASSVVAAREAAEATGAATALRAEAEILRKQLAASKAVISEHEDTIRELNARMTAQISQQTALHETVAAARQAAIQDASADLHAAIARADGLEDELKEALESFSALQDAFDAEQEAKRTADARVVLLETDIATAEARVSALEAEVREANSRAEVAAASVIAAAATVEEPSSLGDGTRAATTPLSATHTTSSSDQPLFAADLLSSGVAKTLSPRAQQLEAEQLQNVLDARESAYTSRLATLEGEVDALTTTLTAERQAVEVEMARIANSITGLKERHAEALRAANSRASEAEQALGALREQHLLLSAEAEDLRSRNDELASEVSRAHELVVVADSEQQTTRDRLLAENQARLAAGRDSRAIRTRLTQLQGRVQRLQAELAAKDAALAKATAEARRAAEKLTATLQQFSTLKSERDAAKHDATSARTKLRLSEAALGEAKAAETKSDAAAALNARRVAAAVEESEKLKALVDRERAIVHDLRNQLLDAGKRIKAASVEHTSISRQLAAADDEIAKLRARPEKDVGAVRRAGRDEAKFLVARALEKAETGFAASLAEIEARLGTANSALRESEDKLAEERAKNRELVIQLQATTVAAFKSPAIAGGSGLMSPLSPSLGRFVEPTAAMPMTPPPPQPRGLASAND